MANNSNVISKSFKFERENFMSFNDLARQHESTTRIPVIFYDRVSPFYTPGFRDFADRLYYVQRYYGKRIEIFEYFREVSDGLSVDLDKRQTLKHAINVAVRFEIRTIITPSVDRIIRQKSSCWDNTDQTRVFTDDDIRRWKAFAKQWTTSKKKTEFTIATLISPATDFDLVYDRLATMNYENCIKRD